jgi:uncharacterized phage-associated protein
MIIDLPAVAAPPAPKLANTILYLLERCRSVPPGKQALLKMLWFADYWHYQEHLKVITDAEYIAMPNGPVIENYQDVFDSLERDGVLKLELKPVYNKPYKKEEYWPLLESDVAQFSSIELRTLERVIFECAGQSGSELSRRTHLEGPWLFAWNAQNPNQPIHRVLFRWLDNLPDELDHVLACRALARESVQRDLAALAA